MIWLSKSRFEKLFYWKVLQLYIQFFKNIGSIFNVKVQLNPDASQYTT